MAEFALLDSIGISILRLPSRPRGTRGRGGGMVRSCERMAGVDVVGEMWSNSAITHHLTLVQ